MLLYKSGIKYCLKSDSEVLKSVKKEYGFSFAKHTTYGLGGTAKIAFYPKNLKEAAAVYSYLNLAKIKFITIGAGSDILASSKGFDGVVVSTACLSGIIRIDKNTLFCLAGTRVCTLLNYCKINALGGLEYLAGIPASIGGLAFMNGGAGGKYIADSVKSVKSFVGKINNISAKKCDFSYKHSTMQDINSPILGVFLSVLPTSRQKVAERIKHYISSRGSLPSGRSCGCVFKNPFGVSAGKLIEEAHLKGKRIGGAYVSEKHANFILSDGATAEEVFSLISLIKDEVFKCSGVMLEEEVRYIGEFNETDS